MEIRIIPDFPTKGIQFKDITPALLNPITLNTLINDISFKFSNLGITKVIGIESRGLILAPAIAAKLNAGFVPARKPGKLPAETIEISYQKEYGTDTLQIHKDAITSDDIVLIHDDILATGGTLNAVIDLVKSLGVKTIYVNCLASILELKGCELFKDKVKNIYIVDE